MNFRNIEKQEDGNFVFDVEANKQEVAFLVDYAISNLLTAGMINIQEGVTAQEINLGAGSATVN